MQYEEFPATTSNTNISETKDFFSILEHFEHQKQKIFSRFFIAYLECASNLEHFEKNDEHPSLVISEIVDSERGGYLNV